MNIFGKSAKDKIDKKLYEYEKTLPDMSSADIAKRVSFAMRTAQDVSLNRVSGLEASLLSLLILTARSALELYERMKTEGGQTK